MDLEKQFAAVREELAALQMSIAPCSIFINEILEARKRRSLSESSSHSLFSMLLLEIKGELIKDIHAMFAGADEVVFLREKFEENNKETFEEIASLRQIVFASEAELRTQANSIHQANYANKEVREKLDEMKLQMEGKATASNLQELRHLIKNCVTVSAFDILKNRVGECALKYQLDDIQKNSLIMKKSLQKCVKVKTMNESLKGVREEVSEFLQKEYIGREMYHLEKDGILKKIIAESERVSETNSNIVKNEAIFLKKLTNLKRQLDSAPWSNNISDIHKSLAERATYDDLDKFRKEINLVISQCNKNIADYKKNIQDFEGVLARFDEILLIKAEKDEISRIEQKMLDFVDLKLFETTTSPQRVAIEKIQDAIKKLIQSADIMDKHLDSVSVKCNSVIKDSVDVSLIAKNLHSLEEVLNRKANKEDIYEIYDLMGRKIEISLIAETNLLQKKQLELCAVLLQTLCRTLVKNGENPLLIQKKREDLLNSINSLVNWIAGEISQSPQQFLLPPRSENISKDYSKSIEIRSRTPKSRNNRRNSLCLKNEHKVPVDFPKIKIS